MEFQKEYHYEQTLQELLATAKGIDKKAYQQAIRRWNAIAKPLYGMGVLEDDIARIASIQGTNLHKKCVVVMCADNGIVAEGVTQTGSEVTAIVAGNIMAGEATVANMARVAGAEVFAYDVGMITERDTVPARKSARGSENFLHSLAMSRNQSAFAILTGIEIVREKKAEGYSIIATGEMGIGNTTTSSAVTASIFEVDANLVTGRGAGLTAEGVVHKAEVINRALALHQVNVKDPLDILSKVGGFDIAAICGLFLGGMIYGVPIVIDGFISSVGALLAVMLAPEARDYMIASHLSAEPAARMVMERLDFAPPLHCGMALGEGTGAVALLPLLDMALAVFLNMPTFQDIEIEEYQPLS